MAGQFCGISHYKSTEKIERRLFWTKTIRNTLKHWVTGRLDTLHRKFANSDPPHVTEVTSGHERSPAVFGITFDGDKLEMKTP